MLPVDNADFYVRKVVQSSTQIIFADYVSIQEISNRQIVWAGIALVLYRAGCEPSRREVGVDVSWWRSEPHHHTNATYGGMSGVSIRVGCSIRPSKVDADAKAKACVIDIFGSNGVGSLPCGRVKPCESDELVRGIFPLIKIIPVIRPRVLCSAMVGSRPVVLGLRPIVIRAPPSIVIVC